MLPREDIERLSHLLDGDQLATEHDASADRPELVLARARLLSLNRVAEKLAESRGELTPLGEHAIRAAVASQSKGPAPARRTVRRRSVAVMIAAAAAAVFGAAHLLAGPVEPPTDRAPEVRAVAPPTPIPNHREAVVAEAMMPPRVAVPVPAAEGDEVDRRWRLARALLRAHQDHEALAEFEWLWLHSLQVKPGWYGVRGSFLLSALRPLLGRSTEARAAFTKNT